MKYISKMIPTIALLICSQAFADEATRLKAVTFALTGEDKGIEVIDDINCIYMKRTDISREIFYMNKIQPSRTTYVPHKYKGADKTFYEIFLHGSEAFFVSKAQNDQEIANFKNDLTIAYRKLGIKEGEINSTVQQNWSPQAKDISQTEKKITVELDDFERYKRAWAYIYANGCVGAKDDF